MRILVTSPTGSANPYVDDCLRHLPASLEIIRDPERFWTPGDADLVHIQWPEELVSWRRPGAEDLSRLEATLAAWRERGTPLVLTLHNDRPHLARSPRDPSLRWLRTVQAACDGVVHLGERSAAAARASDRYRSGAHHEVIRHPLPTPIPWRPERARLREILGLPHRGRLVLVPGSCRHHRERELLLRLAHRAGPELVLIAPIFGGHARPAWRAGLWRRFTWQVDRARARHQTSLLAGQGVVSTAAMGLLARAADVVLVPRFGTLNSGIPALAAAYRRPVVGPDTGTIGEDLARWQQMRFATPTAATVRRALAEAGEPPPLDPAHSQQAVAAGHLALWRHLLEGEHRRT